MCVCLLVVADAIQWAGVFVCVSVCMNVHPFQRDWRPNDNGRDDGDKDDGVDLSAASSDAQRTPAGGRVQRVLVVWKCTGAAP